MRGRADIDVVSGGGGSRAVAHEVRAVGDLACIIDLADLEAVLSVAAALRRAALPGVIDVVPAARTVLVRCTDRVSLRGATEFMSELLGAAGAGALDAAERPAAEGSVAYIDVVYNGADLAEVAALTGMSVAAVVEAHSGTEWRAAFGGFAPGFVYLSGGDGRLRVPRLESPRTVVPAGSVAIAGEFSAVYPGASPGGWRLLGCAVQRVWDTSREVPALITPGDTVRFRAVRDGLVLRPESTEPGELVEGEPAEHVSAVSAGPAGPVFTVLAPGLQTLVQDGGRPGLADIGVAESGALDRGALKRANSLVGNTELAPALEHVGGGLELRVEHAASPVHLAVTGAECEITVTRAGGLEAECAVPDTPGAVLTLCAGDTLRLGADDRGLRSYVAVRGGITRAGERPELGSFAHDSLSGLGAPPLRVGDRLVATGEMSADEAATSAGAPNFSPPAEARPVIRPVLRFVPGPRQAWFSDAALTEFTTQTWRVSPQSNRVGLRLQSAAEASAPTVLERARHEELASEGMVAGSVQVPPNGQPVLFLADHPVTGGYPVIGTVISADLDKAAQLAPGAEVRFEPVDPDTPSPPRTFGPETPTTVSFSIEVDGQRFSVTVPGALAAAIDAAAGRGSAIRPLITHLAKVALGHAAHSPRDGRMVPRVSE